MLKRKNFLDRERHPLLEPPNSPHAPPCFSALFHAESSTPQRHLGTMMSRAEVVLRHASLSPEGSQTGLRLLSLWASLPS